MKKSQRILLVATIGVAAAAAGLWLGRQFAPAPPALERATLFAEARPLPRAELVDHRGEPYDLARLAGRWTLMFFGFTHCPDICPATLVTLAETRRQLADLPEVRQPEVVFVSVDPRRDTPDKLAAYLGFFDPRFTGLTGSGDAVADFTRQMGVAVQLGAPDETGAYGVDHTAAVFLIDPEAAWAGVFGTPHLPDVIARDYRAIVASRS